MAGEQHSYALLRCPDQRCMHRTVAGQLYCGREQQTGAGERVPGDACSLQLPTRCGRREMQGSWQTSSRINRPSVGPWSLRTTPGANPSLVAHSDPANPDRHHEALRRLQCRLNPHLKTCLSMHRPAAAVRRPSLRPETCSIGHATGIWSQRARDGSPRPSPRQVSCRRLVERSAR